MRKSPRAKSIVTFGGVTACDDLWQALFGHGGVKVFISVVRYEISELIHQRVKNLRMKPIAADDV
jgi:hypothetical protein